MRPPIIPGMASLPPVDSRAPQPPQDPSEKTPPPAPAYLLPDLYTLPPDNLQWRVSASGQKTLRFANSVANIGNGYIEMYGEYVSGVDEQAIRVTQWVQNQTGDPLKVSVGLFIFHPVHQHWHWESFSRYEVWALDESNNLSRVVQVSGKVGFCLRDIEPVPSGEGEPDPLWSARARYGSCGWRKQGLSAGWADRYERHLTGQSMDLSHVPDGIYALVSTANPDQMIIESNRNNNTAVVYFEIRGSDMQVVPPPASAYRSGGIPIMIPD